MKLWDDRPAPLLTAGKIAAILSLCLWIGVICAGRVIGFTSTQKATEAAPAGRRQLRRLPRRRRRRPACAEVRAAAGAF